MTNGQLLYYYYYNVLRTQFAKSFIALTNKVNIQMKTSGKNNISK